MDAYHFQFIVTKLLTENLAPVAVWLGHISKKHPDVFETAQLFEMIIEKLEVVLN